MIKQFGNPEWALPFARIENHYFTNYLKEGLGEKLLEDIGQLKEIPIRIVQGRFDMVCPIETAWDVKKVLDLPDDEFRVVKKAGHSALESGTLHELIQATEDFKKL